MSYTVTIALPDHRSVCAPDVCGGPTCLGCTPEGLQFRRVLTRGVWMPVGIVKWYDCKKGFGFIVDPAGEDVLAHFSVIEGDGFRRLYSGEQVEFEALRGERGLQATKVRRLNPEGRAHRIKPTGRPSPDRAT